MLGDSDPVVLAADIGRQQTLDSVVELAGRIPLSPSASRERNWSAASALVGDR